MSLAIVLRRHGGPEVFGIEERELGAPGPGEIRVRHTAIGVNFHDIYVREGKGGHLALPGVPGIEAAGVVEAIGEGVDGLRLGQRIAYLIRDYGCYAEEANIPAAFAMPLPAALSDVGAASTLLKAVTARMLLERASQVQAGQTILVHAASGGAGQFICQWAKALGATVIGTVSTSERSGAALRAGADHVIARSEVNFVDAVEEITGGLGVSAAYDSIGVETFASSLKCVTFGGTLVNYGDITGEPAPVTFDMLRARSVAIRRPSVFHFLRTNEERAEAYRAVLNAFEQGWLRPMEPLRFSLEDVARAHETLENRGGPGGIVLEP